VVYRHLKLGGVPDLCLWRSDTNSFKLVEVKSQNDRLSDKQVIWLDFLVSFGIEAEIFSIRNK
jgi:Fanconi-associated nuclease 1